MIKKIVVSFFITLGLFLIIINVIGVGYPPSLAEVASDFTRLQMSRASPQWAAEAVKRLEGRKSRDLVQSVMVTVNQRMVNFLERDDYGYVPISENWFLWLLGKMDVKYRKYVFSNHESALRRGTGQCYQQALVVVSMLQKFGVRAGVVGLHNHVIARANFDDESYLIDPDYGVLMQFDLDYAKNNIDEVREKYTKMLSQFSSSEIKESQLDKIMKAYQNAPTVQAGDGVEGSVVLEKIEFEKQAYVIKWVLPFTFIVLGFSFFVYMWKNRK